MYNTGYPDNTSIISRELVLVSLLHVTFTTTPKLTTLGCYRKKMTSCTHGWPSRATQCTRVTWRVRRAAARSANSARRFSKSGLISQNRELDPWIQFFLDESAEDKLTWWKRIKQYYRWNYFLELQESLVVISSSKTSSLCYKIPLIWKGYRSNLTHALVL